MSSRILLSATLLLTAVLTGCVSTELSGVRNDLARQMPEASIGDGRTFSFGAVSLGFARLVSGLVGEDSQDVRAVLRGVRRVQVGRFDVAGPVDAPGLRMPARLRRYVDREGWEHLVTFRQDGEAGWVLYRARGERITDLFVTVLSDDELLLARISGDLTGVALALLQQGDVALPMFREASTAQERRQDEAAVEAAAALAP
jgi:hypothetical protein